MVKSSFRTGCYFNLSMKITGWVQKFRVLRGVYSNDFDLDIKVNDQGHLRRKWKDNFFLPV